MQKSSELPSHRDRIDPRISRQRLRAGKCTSDGTERTMQNLLAALPADSYDLGVLAGSRMQRFETVTAHRLLHMLSFLSYRNANGAHIYFRPTGESAYTLLDDLTSNFLARMIGEGFGTAAVVETSPGNFQAWLRHAQPLPKQLGSLAAKMLAARFSADASAADWRRFGRAPGFTNQKPKYRDARGCFPDVLLHEHGGEVFAAANVFNAEVLTTHKQQDQANAERKRILRTRPSSLPDRLTLPRFRDALRYRDRPAAADLVFSICASAHGWSEVAIAEALRAQYLSRNTDVSQQNAYLRRTIRKAFAWIAR